METRKARLLTSHPMSTVTLFDSSNLGSLCRTSPDESGGGAAAAAIQTSGMALPVRLNYQALTFQLGPSSQKCHPRPKSAVISPASNRSHIASCANHAAGIRAPRPSIS